MENRGAVAWRKKGKWVGGRAGTSSSALQRPLAHPTLLPVLVPGGGCPARFLSAQPGWRQEGALGTFWHSSQRSAFLPGSLLTTASVFAFTELFHS